MPKPTLPTVTYQGKPWYFDAQTDMLTAVDDKDESVELLEVYHHLSDDDRRLVYSVEIAQSYELAQC